MSGGEPGYTVTVSSKGQVTLPAALRQAYGLDKGDRVRFIEGADGRICLVPVTRALSDLAGRFADAPARAPEADPLGAALAEDDARIRKDGAEDAA